MLEANGSSLAGFLLRRNQFIDFLDSPRSGLLAIYVKPCAHRCDAKWDMHVDADRDSENVRNNTRCEELINAVIEGDALLNERGRHVGPGLAVNVKSDHPDQRGETLGRQPSHRIYMHEAIATKSDNDESWRNG